MIRRIKSIKVYSLIQSVKEDTLFETELNILFSDGSFYWSTSDPLIFNQKCYKLFEKSFHSCFSWNEFLIGPIKQYICGTFRDVDNSQGIFPQIIRGFISSEIVAIGDITAKIVLISRISAKRFGPLFSVRGLDDEGNVAGFIETETIIETEHESFSYCILRGSVPGI